MSESAYPDPFSSGRQVAHVNSGGGQRPQRSDGGGRGRGGRGSGKKRGGRGGGGSGENSSGGRGLPAPMHTGLPQPMHSGSPASNEKVDNNRKPKAKAEAKPKPKQLDNLPPPPSNGTNLPKPMHSTSVSGPSRPTPLQRPAPLPSAPKKRAALYSLTPSDPSYGRGRKIKLLHVAEKPSIAASVANALSSVSSSNYNQSKGVTPIHEFDTSAPPFHPAPGATSCHHIVTAVTGHVFNVDFPQEYQSWDSIDPASLYTAPVVRKPCKGSLLNHLRNCAKSTDFVVLWMDCDREGENINFEVLSVILPTMSVGFSHVYRAKFSAIAVGDILKAYGCLIKPDQHQSHAVDARQELDLKVGVSFSRFQTRYFQGRYGDLDSSVISYGPCQTPTLGFVVQRMVEIEMFRPEPFWSLDLGVFKQGRISRCVWGGGRSFNKGKVEALAARAVEVEVDENGNPQPGSVVVTKVLTREKKQSRPTPMNTVAFLKACSTGLGIGPHHALQTAERLYLSGFLSYPRTESTAYPKSYDVVATLRDQSRDPRWGSFVRDLLNAGPSRNSKGVDMGDHPPITPCAPAPPGTLSGDQARVYEMVVRHFIATVSYDALWESTNVTLACPRLGDKGIFTLSGKKLIAAGFLAILLHRQYGDENRDEEDEEERQLPNFFEGEVFPVSAPNTTTESGGVKVAETGARAKMGVKEGVTQPPGLLTESELITIMEKNGIGTDASIPTHIENILKRNYASLESGRRIKGTELGVVLAQGYHAIDSGLVLPKVRADIEHQCDQIAKGLADKEDVIAKSLRIFEDKFEYFVSSIAKMDVLFGSHFSKLEDVGKAFTRCGLTKRYLQYIQGPPTRLYNRFTGTVYTLPMGGMVKQWSGKRCPVAKCNFEMCLYTVGSPGRTFPLCPNCYNNPDSSWGGIAADDGGAPPPIKGEDEDIDAQKARQAAIAGRKIVLDSPLPDGHPSVEELTVCPDLSSGGVFILDPSSKNKWTLVSTKAPIILHLPKQIKFVRVLNKRDPPTGCRYVEITFKPGESVMPGGEEVVTSCMVADEVLQSMVTVHRGSERSKPTGRGGRGRGGRGGRGRGRGRGRDRDRD